MENELWELLVHLEDVAKECKQFEKSRARKGEYEAALELKYQSQFYSRIARKLKKILNVKPSAREKSFELCGCCDHSDSCSRTKRCYIEYGGGNDF